MMNVGTLVSAAIRPNNSLDPIASAFASEIKGGLHTASSSTDRDSIIFERRDWGMMCYVVDQDITYQLKYGYVNTDIMNNANWIEFTGGGSGGSGGNEWIDSVLSVVFGPPATYSIGDRYLAGTNPNQTLTGAWQTYSAGVVFEWNSINWIPTYPTDGMSLRVDNEDNSIYRYEGVYPIGGWNKEKLSQIRAIDINTTNGVLFTTDELNFQDYIRDMIFLSTFTQSNTGTTASLNINSLGEVIIKKPTSTGLVDLTPGDIIPGLVYSLVYDGDYFQLIKHYSDGSGLSIKYYIEPNDYITVPPYHQYWVYGDLTIDGTLVNYGEVFVVNGSLKLQNGTFSNSGTLNLLTLAQGYLSGSSSIYFNDSDTIQIVEQNTITGLSVSAFIKPDSITVSNLKTVEGGATAGYILSNDGLGNFKWIDKVDSFYQNSDIMPVPVGGIDAGSSFSTPTLIQDVLDQLLYPELNPTLTAPSSTFTSTVMGLREIGEVINTIAFNSIFNRGSINPQYQSDSPFRSGLPNSYQYTGTDIVGTYNSTSLNDTRSITNYTVLSGTQSWQGRVNYDAGVQPKTNKGTNFGSPLSAGSTSYITTTITGVYPFFATSEDIDILTKQPLKNMNGTPGSGGLNFFQFNLVADDLGNNKRQTFRVPVAFSTITGIQQFNTNNNQWEYIQGNKANSLTNLNTIWIKTNIDLTIQGNSVPYLQYVYNGAQSGFRQIRIIVN